MKRSAKRWIVVVVALALVAFGVWAAVGGLGVKLDGVVAQVASLVEQSPDQAGAGTGTDVGAGEGATEGASADAEADAGDSTAEGAAEANGAATGGNTLHLNQLPDSTFLYDTDIAEIVHADTYLDGQTVQIRGEVVGDLIKDEADPNRCWIVVQDNNELNPNAVTALITNEQAAVIDSLGSYDTQGTTVQIRGTFNLECIDHEGLSDIHAEEVTLVAQGSEVQHRINPAILAAGVVAVALGLILLAIYSIARERQR